MRLPSSTTACRKSIFGHHIDGFGFAVLTCRRSDVGWSSNAPVAMARATLETALPHSAANSSGSSETRGMWTFGITRAWPARRGMMSSGPCVYAGRRRRGSRCCELNELAKPGEPESNLELRRPCRFRTACTRVPRRVQSCRIRSPRRWPTGAGVYGSRAP